MVFNFWLNKTLSIITSLSYMFDICSLLFWVRFERASICRHFENEVYKRIVKKEIEFPVYLSAGQEYAPATIAEIVSKKKIKPLIFGQHRGHSIYLSFGGDINKLIKELKGKKDGCTYGMCGSLSIHSMKINMYGHDGFMGSNACIGTGACFSSKKPFHF